VLGHKREAPGEQRCGIAVSRAQHSDDLVAQLLVRHQTALVRSVHQREQHVATILRVGAAAYDGGINDFVQSLDRVAEALLLRRVEFQFELA
jgi:hypothetical protein